MAYRLFPSKSFETHNINVDHSRVKQTERAKRPFLIRLILTGIFIFHIAACATTELPAEKKPVMNLPESFSFLDYSSEDRKLFEEGLAKLKTTPERPADHAEAGKIFETLVQKYPDSKWRRQAEIWLDQLGAYSQLEEKLNTCQKQGKDDQNEQNRLQRENDQLRRDIRQISEKNQEEINRINQENEQLRRDIRLLKNMEIQRENRERMLR